MEKNKTLTSPEQVAKLAARSLTDVIWAAATRRELGEGMAMVVVGESESDDLGMEETNPPMELACTQCICITLHSITTPSYINQLISSWSNPKFFYFLF